MCKNRGRGTQIARDTQTAQQDAIKYLLEKYPDVKGIFATNETVADLVVNVLDSMDKTTGEDRIKVVGFDGGEDQMKLLEDGKIDGLIVQNPYGIRLCNGCCLRKSSAWSGK